MRSSALLLTGLLLVGTAAACTTHYTQADLDAEEVQRSQEDEEEEKRDREIGQEGGSNEEGMDEQMWEAERQSEL